MNYSAPLGLCYRDSARRFGARRHKMWRQRGAIPPKLELHLVKKRALVPFEAPVKMRTSQGTMGYLVGGRGQPFGSSALCRTPGFGRNWPVAACAYGVRCAWFLDETGSAWNG